MISIMENEDNEPTVNIKNEITTKKASIAKKLNNLKWNNPSWKRALRMYNANKKRKIKNET